MRKTILKILLALLLAGILAGGALVGAVVYCAGKERTVKPSDCLIVLGAKVHPSGELSKTLRYRCESALEVWRQGLVKGIVCCGARGADEPVAEGEAMRDYLIEHGVPESCVIAETQSVNTEENLKNAAGIMESRGWADAVVATSDYHLERALWLARDMGLDACGVAAPTPAPLGVAVGSRLRESASWILYALRKAF